jgi:hypothetical protein
LTGRGLATYLQAMLRPLPGSSITIEIADPEHPDLDALDLGDSDDGGSIAAYLASRWWVVIQLPPTLYRFGDADGSTVGFAVIRDQEMPHPRHDSSSEPNCLYVFNFGVVRRFQGQAEPVSGNTYAFEALRAVDELVLPETDSVATLLAARDGNCSARRLYERAGFEYDAAGRVFEHDDWWHVMRKPRR